MTERVGEIVEGDGVRRGAAAADEARTARLVALGRALSDPTRVGMLGLLAEGRGCCDLPDLGLPGEEAGICICEFQEIFGMGQSRVSYHMGRLREAGLVQERRQGKWSYYSLDREAAEGLLGEAAALLIGARSGDGRV